MMAADVATDDADGPDQHVAEPIAVGCGGRELQASPDRRVSSRERLSRSERGQAG